MLFVNCRVVRHPLDTIVVGGAIAQLNERKPVPTSWASYILSMSILAGWYG